MVAVEAAGVDTWSPAWYVNEGSQAERALRAMCAVPAGRSWLMPDPVLGHRVGWFPGSRLAFAEGHPAHAVGELGLGAGDDLPMALFNLEAELWDLGVRVEPKRSRSHWGGVARPQTADRAHGFAGVRRLDVTADLRFGGRAEGLAVLSGVAAVGMPRSKTSVWRATGRGPIETVGFYGYSGKKMVGRWYDKGIEAGVAPRGRLIRPEDQRRYPLAQRRAVEELTSPYVRDRFRSRFVPLWRASQGVTVAGIRVLAARLGDRVEAGDLSIREAERLVGYLVLDQAGCWAGRRSTRYNRERDLRDAGLVAADGELDEVEVNLHEVLEEALEADAWGVG